MAYDLEKYRKKREKVLGVRKRGLSFSVVAAIVSIVIVTGLGAVVVPRTAGFLAFGLGAKLAEFSTGQIVVSIQIVAFAANGGTPEARWAVVPRLRIWSARHFEPPVTKPRGLAESPKRPACHPEFRVYSGYGRSVGVFQIDVNPYRVTVERRRVELPTSALRTQRSPN